VINIPMFYDKKIKFKLLKETQNKINYG